MGKIIQKNAVTRKARTFYYVDKKGNLCEAPMAGPGRKKATRQMKVSRAPARKKAR